MIKSLSQQQSREVSRRLLETLGRRMDWLSDSLDGALTMNSSRVRIAIAIAMLGTEKVTSSDIARRTGVNPTTVHRIITTMIIDGQITEMADPDDGRKRLLSFTEEHFQTIIDQINGWVSVSLDGASDDVKALTAVGLLPQPAGDTVAEFVVKVQRDGTLKLADGQRNANIVLESDPTTPLPTRQ